MLNGKKPPDRGLLLITGIVIQPCDKSISRHQHTATLERRLNKLNDFGPSHEVIDVIECLPTSEMEDLLYKKAVAAGVEFTEEEKLSMRNLGEIISDAINNMPSDEEIEEFGKNVQVLCDQLDAIQNPPKRKLGFGAGLFAVLAGLFSGSGKKHSHHCTGNCASCPPHYGYRYGRWYYGHGHQWGCELGGNGGASGRTSRD